ncbi:histone-like nucleoid-structuring protein Lsr2 [Streptomyces canus]|uniref:Lsr2 family DNA-binding protein n=1 Tax=Streptomyces canus TaxID=58343 RepID=UPI0036D0D12F
MFTDMREALAAEDLEVLPLGSAQYSAAALVVAHHARDKGDLADLLGALGLPCGEEDLVPLLPHLTNPVDTPTGDPMPVNAFTATAASMLNNGDSPDHVRETLGLSESELADAIQHAQLPASDADSKDATDIPETTAARPGDTIDVDGTDDSGPAPDTRQAGLQSVSRETLLAWAENHPAASIRNRAARVRSDLTELSERRAADAAQREAEERVAKAKAELEAAQAQLRQVKSGGRAATEDQATTAVGPALEPNGNGKRSKDELAAIRTWARAHGHQVADRGTPAKTVLDAYDAAHRTITLAEAS